MSYFDSVKRHAHKVEIDGQTHYVRSLTQNEAGGIPTDADGATDVDKTFYLLRHGVCDKHGATVLTDDDRDRLFDLPISTTVGLVDAILNLLTSKKS